MNKSRYIVVGEGLECSKVFDCLAKARNRAKELAQSQPGKPVYVYELKNTFIGEVAVKET